MYRDGFSAYPQEMPINPGNVSPSGLQQSNYVPGNQKLNGQIPFGTMQQQQPDTSGSSSQFD